jgi:hypothetical protein
LEKIRMELTCPKCDVVLVSEGNCWDKLGEEVSCCGVTYEIEYDETYDEEANEEWGWFFLTEITK